MKSNSRLIIKERKGIIETSDIRKNCKKCYYHGTHSKVCQLHLIKTKTTEVCSEFTSMRKATVYQGGATSPR